jgi:uroporphyrinogen-III synthase
MGTVLVTRPVGHAGPLVEALREAGLRTHAVPTVAFEPVDPAAALRPALADLTARDWLVLTSPQGAATVSAEVLALAPERRPRVGVIGPGTRQASVGAGLTVSATATQARPDALVLALTAQAVRGCSVVLARSDAADPGLPDALKAAGARVRDVVAYRTIVAPGTSRSALRRALSDPATRAVHLASGSALRGALVLAGGLASRLAELRIATIGPATSALVRESGLVVAAEAARPDVAAQVAAIRRALADR